MVLRIAHASPSMAILRDEAAKRFLVDVGLPVEHFLFGWAEPIVRRAASDGAERSFVRLGMGGDDVEFCVDIETAEVVLLNLADASVWHVNESPDKFAACLDEFMSGYPYGDGECELEDREAMAASLKEALLVIDATAFDDDPGYWYTILGDVAIGDYSDD